MNDRFAPPRADVGDEPPGSAPPRVVVIAVRCLWSSLGLGIPAFLYEAGRASGSPGFAVGVVVQLAFFALAAWVIAGVQRGRNWARVVSLVLTVLEVGLVLWAPAPADQAVIEAVCNAVAAALDVVAMVLLYRPAASPWFRRRA